MTTPTPPAIDHVVILVNDLVQATAHFENLGLTVLARDDAQDKPGSSFRFVSFDDGSYLLLNAFSDDARARHRLGPVLAECEGPGDWSVLVDDMDAARDRAQAAGIAVGAEHDVRNVLADGRPWGLRLLLTGRGGGDPCQPFLVQDVTGRAARIPGPVPHANGATGIAALTVAADDPGRAAADLGVLTGQGNASRIGATSVRFVPTDPAARGTARLGGPVSVTLATPAGPVTIAGWPPV